MLNGNHSQLFGLNPVRMPVVGAPPHTATLVLSCDSESLGRNCLASHPLIESYMMSDTVTIIGVHEMDADEREIDSPTAGCRFAFFLHYLNFDLPLATSFGEIDIPKPTSIPQRLGKIKYEAATAIGVLFQNNSMDRNHSYR